MLSTTSSNVDTRTASEIVRAAIEPDRLVTEILPLPGGMSNHVTRWKLNGPPWSIVAKFSHKPAHPRITAGYNSLLYYRDHTSLPTPLPLALVEGPIGKFKGTCLLMQYMPGRHLSRARITHEGRKNLQRQLAQHVADLHTRRRDTYGSALKDGHALRWLDRFRPDFERQYKYVKSSLSKRSRVIVTRLIANLDEYLPESGNPTLIHGDLWSNNILVDDSNTNQPKITACIDGHATFSEPEYELAYLRCFQTANEVFFRHYTRVHKINPGFQDRCQIYWLPMLMRHVRYFGPRYLKPCEKLIADMERFF